MTVDLGNILKSFLEPLVSDGSTSTKFIDKLAGVVRTVTKSETNGNASKKSSFPVSCDIDFSECNNSSVLKDLIPNSKLGCIIYFEDLGGNLERIERGYKIWKFQYKLIGWVNKKKLGDNSCFVTAKIINTILNRFPEQPFNNGIYTQCQIEIVGQDPKSLNPFQKYSYDETITQYLMDPFDYFSLSINIYTAVHKNCITDFELGPSKSNCNT